MHQEKANVFFEKAQDIIQSEAQLAYILGFICHYLLKQLKILLHNAGPRFICDRIIQTCSLFRQLSYCRKEDQ